jgi:hypothetical protein
VLAAMARIARPVHAVPEIVRGRVVSSKQAPLHLLPIVSSFEQPRRERNRHPGIPVTDQRGTACEKRTLIAHNNAALTWRLAIIGSDR